MSRRPRNLYPHTVVSRQIRITWRIDNGKTMMIEEIDDTGIITHILELNRDQQITLRNLLCTELGAPGT